MTSNGNGRPWHEQAWRDGMSIPEWVRMLRLMRDRGIWAEWEDLDHNAKKMPKRFGNKQVVIAYCHAHPGEPLQAHDGTNLIGAMGDWLIRTYADRDQMAEQLDLWASTYVSGGSLRSRR